MQSTFWIKDDQLDADQRQAVELIRHNRNFLLNGPAGSGKTNILLLLARWLTLKGLPNLKLIAFTGGLREFIALGCVQYGVDPACSVTQMTLFKNILNEHSVALELSGDFETDRTTLSGMVKSLLDAGRISDSYCQTLLVDEAQDYTDTELLVLRGLTKNLILATDLRQSIYKATHTPGLPEKLVSGLVMSLKYHYRSGLNLCKVADAVLTGNVSYGRLQNESHYPESEMPSSVTSSPCESFDEQLHRILERLNHQLALYPSEKIGVIFPKREQAERARTWLATKLGQDSLSRLWIDTIHRSKGLEFRAVHIAGCEELYRMGPTQKRLIYTGILRGKTSATIHYSGHIPGYLEAALNTLEAPRPDPKISELF